jgi:hypothetical protein
MMKYMRALFILFCSLAAVGPCLTFYNLVAIRKFTQSFTKYGPLPEIRIPIIEWVLFALAVTSEGKMQLRRSASGRKANDDKQSTTAWDNIPLDSWIGIQYSKSSFILPPIAADSGSEDHHGKRGEKNSGKPNTPAKT